MKKSILYFLVVCLMFALSSNAYSGSISYYAELENEEGFDSDGGGPIKMNNLGTVTMQVSVSLYKGGEDEEVDGYARCEAWGGPVITAAAGISEMDPPGSAFDCDYDTIYVGDDPEYFEFYVEVYIQYGDCATAFATSYIRW